MVAALQLAIHLGLEMVLAEGERDTRSDEKKGEECCEAQVGEPFADEGGAEEPVSEESQENEDPDVVDVEQSRRKEAVSDEKGLRAVVLDGDGPMNRKEADEDEEEEHVVAHFERVHEQHGRESKEHGSEDSEPRAENSAGEEEHCDHAADVEEDAKEPEVGLCLADEADPDPEKNGEEWRVDVAGGEVKELTEAELGSEGGVGLVQPQLTRAKQEELEACADQKYQAKKQEWAFFLSKQRSIDLASKYPDL